MAKSGWKLIKIEQLAASKRHALAMGPFGSRITKDNFVDAGVPVIRGTNLSKGRFDHSDLVFLTEEKANELAASNAIADDLVFTHRGTLGQVGIIPKGYYPRYVVSQSQMKLTCDQTKVFPMFLYYFFRSSLGQHEILSHTGGSGVPAISSPLTTLKSAMVPLPPLPTQQKIATILSAYDDLIENNTRRIAILEEMAQSIYQEWFVHFRYPGHENDKMVESELGMIPEGWEVKTIADVCSRITDGSHWSPKTVTTGYPMASVKDMHNWGFHLDQCRKISEDDYQKLVQSDCKPLKGDVLIAKDGSYLKHNFVIHEERNLVILSSIAILRANRQIRPYLLSLYLSDPLVKLRMQGYVSGVALPRIILKNFANFPILVTPETLQSKFLEIIEPIMGVCYNLTEKNVNLKRTRDLLLPKLISGEIDVETLNIDIPNLPEPQEHQYEFPITRPEPIDATQLALPLSP